MLVIVPQYSIKISVELSVYFENYKFRFARPSRFFGQSLKAKIPQQIKRSMGESVEVKSKHEQGPNLSSEQIKLIKEYYSKNKKWIL